MNEEVRALGQHGLIDAHPAEVRVDAPALPGRVAGEHEPDVAAAARGGSEATHHRLAGGAPGVQVLERHAHEDVLVVGKIPQIDSRRVVGDRQRGGALDAGGVLKARRGGPLDDHP